MMAGDGGALTPMRVAIMTVAVMVVVGLVEWVHELEERRDLELEQAERVRELARPDLDPFEREALEWVLDRERRETLERIYVAAWTEVQRQNRREQADRGHWISRARIPGSDEWAELLARRAAPAPLDGTGLALQPHAGQGVELARSTPPVPLADEEHIGEEELLARARELDRLWQAYRPHRKKEFEAQLEEWDQLERLNG